MHHPKLIDHFRNPRNAGELENADAVVETSNPVCGDVVKLWARVENGRIADIRFKCRGCTAAIACASALTELARERGVQEVITAGMVEEAIGELPSASKHAAQLAAEAWERLRRSLPS